MRKKNQQRVYRKSDFNKSLSPCFLPRIEKPICAFSFFISKRFSRFSFSLLLFHS